MVVDSLRVRVKGCVKKMFPSRANFARDTRQLHSPARGQSPDNRLVHRYKHLTQQRGYSRDPRQLAARGQSVVESVVGPPPDAHETSEAFYHEHEFDVMITT